jgi:hypothetical protein
MRLARIDQAITACQTHLQNSGATGTEIEAYLTRYLLVMIYSTFEEEIKSLIIKRAAGSGDPGMESFVQSAMGRTSFRSLMTREIGDFLNRFGLDYKNRFRQQLDSNPRAETFFNNIVTNRHDTAHSTGSTISFSDLVSFYSEGHIVLDAIIVALQV